MKVYYVLFATANLLTIGFLLLADRSLDKLGYFPSVALFRHLEFQHYLVINVTITIFGLILPVFANKKRLWIWGLCFIALHLFAIICAIRWALAQSL